MVRAAAKKGKRRGAAAAQEPLVNGFATTHGDYQVESMAVAAGELGEARAGQVRVLRNRGSTTVERWKAAGGLSAGQAEAIALYARCHRRWLGERRVTMNWNLSGSFRGADMDEAVHGKIEAKRMLDHLDELVFNGMPPAYVDVWRNVVLSDEAAGVAGARLGYKNKGAEASAKAIVLFIADMIATKLRLGG